MKLQIKFVEVAGHRFLALCDESGEILPDQSELTVFQKPDDVLRARVEFIVGGDVRLIGDQD